MSVSEEPINEAPDLDQRLEKLSKIDHKIMDILTTVRDIFGGYDRERQYARNKMEDLYKRYDKNVEDVYGEISEQLLYMEKMCVGAEHQGSTFNIQQQSELVKQRTEALYSKLSKINKLSSEYNNKVIAETFLNPENINNHNTTFSNLKLLKNMQLSEDDLKEIQLAFAKDNDNENEDDEYVEEDNEVVDEIENEIM